MYESSSGDSSDHGERSRNVHMFLVKSKEGQHDLDEDYAYKQKLGDLIFDANFEGGNLGRAEQYDQFDYDLMVRPDVANPRHRIWFNFRVSNQRPKQCVVFNFVNLSENLQLVSEAGLTPVVRSRLEPNWVRMRRNQVFYYRSPMHNNRRILSLAFRFKNHDNEHQFALFYPYTLSTLEHFLARWIVQLKRQTAHAESGKRSSEGTRAIGKVSTCGSGGRPYSHFPNPSSRGRKSRRGGKVGAELEVKTLAQTILSKPVYELNISAPSGGSVELERPQVVVIGRVGANFESISSFVCQGLVDFMLSQDQVATLAREQMKLLVFPMLDPDSIWVGNSRTDLMGQQVTIDERVLAANRSLYNNQQVFRERVRGICGASRQRAIVIEMRVAPNLIGSRMIGSLFTDSLRMEEHLHLPRLLSRFSDGFYLEKCLFMDQRQKSQRATCLPELSLETNEIYRLDISPFGYHKRSLVKDEFQEYDQARYLLLGKSLAHALLELTRPKGVEFPLSVREQINSFSPTSRDIDDLTLSANSGETSTI